MKDRDAPSIRKRRQHTSDAFRLREKPIGKLLTSLDRIDADGRIKTYKPLKKDAQKDRGQDSKPTKPMRESEDKKAAKKDLSGFRFLPCGGPGHIASGCSEEWCEVSNECSLPIDRSLRPCEKTSKTNDYKTLCEDVQLPRWKRTRQK